MADEDASSTGPGLERKLLTILSADVAEYSRLMAEDEEHTIRVFREHRQVFESLVGMHRGRIFNTAGDAILAEFASAVEAVRCATEIQAALRTRNDQLPPARQVRFRIGVNLGDVMVQGTDLMGDGVNVAARLQAAAEPGGICLSGSVYDQIRNKLSLSFKSLGERSFKNIPQPVRTFTITEAEGHGALPSPKRSRRGPGNGLKVAAAAALALLIAGGYWAYSDDRAATERARAVAESEGTARRDAQVAAERAAADLARKEAQLAAEAAALETARKEAREAAERAAAQAEAQRAAERAAAENAVRAAEAERHRLEAERRTAEAARQRAEAARKSAEDESRRVADEERRKAEVARQAAAPPPQEVRLSPPASPPPAAAGFDGRYGGSVCLGPIPTEAAFCFRAEGQLAQGTIAAQFPGRQGRSNAIQGLVSESGEVKMTWITRNPDGSVYGVLDATGTVRDGRLEASGVYRSGRTARFDWRRE